MSEVGEALDRLQRLHPRKIDLGLGRIQRVLEALGHPEARLGRSVHVAGTNGKGSTVAYLRAIGEAAGLSVNAYTSPHLVRFQERIVVHGEEIGDDALLTSLSAVEAANGDAPLSFFEATTAAAFHAFAARPADLTLVEVGLGGRFDATNVFEPSISVITPVALDHAEFLGRDLAKVAVEKAGIVKPGVPVAVGPQTDVAREVIDARAQVLNAPARFWGQDFRAYAQGGSMVYETNSTVLDLPLPALPGNHQIGNAGTAVAVALGLGLGETALAGGLRTANWPARMQSLQTGPFSEMVAESGGELWLDGGHNPHAAVALATAMAGLEARHPRPLVLVMGILANKDAGAYLNAFKGLASGLVALGIPGHASLAPETLSELARNRGIATTVANNLTDAVQRAVNMGEALSRQTVDEPVVAPRVLICGSLYLAGEVLRQN